MKDLLKYLVILFLLLSLCQCSENMPHYKIVFAKGFLFVSSSSIKPVNLSYEIDSYIRKDTILRGNSNYNIFNDLSKVVSLNKLPEQLELHLLIEDKLDSMLIIKVPHIVEKNGRLYFNNLEKGHNITIDYGSYGLETFRIINNDTVVDCLQYLRDNNDKYKIALDATQNNGIVIRAAIANATSETFKIKLDRPFAKSQLYAKEITNYCNPFIRKTLQYCEEEIRKFLFRNNIHFDDNFVKNMGVNYALLEKSDYTEYITRDSIVPIYGNPKELKFKIESNLKADYYYLLLTDNVFSETKLSPSIVSSLDIRSFIEEQVSCNFSDGVSSLDQFVQLYNKRNNGNILMLIGLNKDWTFNYFPLGLLYICDYGPYIFSEKPDNEKEGIEAFARMHMTLSPKKLDPNVISGISSKSRRHRQISGENTIPQPNGIIKEIKLTQPQIVFNELNLVIYSYKNPSSVVGLFTNGSIMYDVNDFYGDYPSIKLSWSDEVTKVEFGNGISFNLSEYRSPHTFSFYYNTIIGKNELPIKVMNKYGYSSSDIIKFEMKRTKNSTTINIENNVYDSPNSTINNEVNIFNE